MNWMLLGGFAFLFAIINLVRAIMGKKYGWEVLMFSSFLCGVYALVALYRQIAQWAFIGDWSAIQDVAPHMGEALVWVAMFGVTINLAAALLNLREKQ